jgi:hypothetical protein
VQTYVEKALGSTTAQRHQTARRAPHPGNAVLALQGRVGNAAVAQLLRQPGSVPPFGSRSSTVPNPAGGAGKPAEPATVQRCGTTPSGSGPCSCCGSEETTETTAAGAPVQRRITVQRRVDGDVRNMSITPEWTRALADPELSSQLMLLRQHITGLPTTDPQREGAATNLRLLEAESERRTAAQALGALKMGQYVPRPARLPDGGFALTELPDVPAEAVGQLPEGQVTTVVTASLYNAAMPQVSLGPGMQGAAQGAARAGDTAGAIAGGGVLGSSVNMRMWGFPGGAVGQYTVGIVVRPRANALDLGHTSLVLRRGGAPLDVVGLNPDMRTPQGLLDFAINYKKAVRGSRAVAGRFTPDSSMFAVDDAIHIEYVITEAEAAQLAMAKPGRAPIDWVGRPAVYRPPPGACQGSNCGLWAIGEIEGQLGGTVGRAADPAGITSMGPGGTVTANRGSQPVIVDMAKGGLNDPATIRPLRPGGAPPVVSAMPRLVKVMRVGGKVMLVVGVVAGVAEVATAKPEERTRTAVGVGGGFAGGFLLGASAGLLCGPGAPVCSFVLGLGLGTIGALGGRAFAEGVYDMTTQPAGGPAGGGGGSTGGQSSAAPATMAPNQQWELLFVPPARPVEALFLDVTRQTPFARPATSLDLAFANQPATPTPAP